MPRHSRDGSKAGGEREALSIAELEQLYQVLDRIREEIRKEEGVAQTHDTASHQQTGTDPGPVINPTYTTAEAICLEASALVRGPRAAAHGDMLLNHRNIADMWNSLLEAKHRRDVADYGSSTLLTALDVANMLEALKIARRYSGSYNPDDYVDGAGYAAVAGEIAARTQ